MTNQPTKSVTNIWIIIGLFLAVFVTGVDSFIISPLLPALGHYFHASIPQVSLGVTIYAICYALGCLFWGPLGDRFPKKKLITIGMSIFLIGTFLCGFATGLATFYLFRAIAGIGASLLVPNIWAFIGAHFKGQQLGIVMGITISALSLSIAIGVPIGTLISQLVNWHMAFWGSGFLALFAFVVILITIPSEAPVQTDRINYFANFIKVQRTPNAVASLLTTFLWMFGFYLVYTFLGTFLTNQYHFNTAATGVIFIVYGLSNFAASFIGGFVNNRLGIMNSIRFNGLASVIIIVMIGGLGTKLAVLIPLLVLLALFQGLGVSALNTFIVNVAPANRSSMMSFNNACLYLGLTVGSFTGGFTYASYGFRTLCLIAASGLMLAILNTFRLRLK